MPRMDVVFFDAGGGHRSAALALRLILQRLGKQWEVRLVHLQEVLDPIDPVRRTTGVRMQEVYNLILRKGWTFGAALLLPALHGVIRVCTPAAGRMLEAHWESSRPDLVVSLIPHFNRVLCESLRRAAPQAQFVTILTDLADYPPHFWIESQEQFLICGTAWAAAQARGMGFPEDRVFRTSGMILHPRFYEPVTVDRSTERQRLGLQPDLPTGLVLFGGLGSTSMLEIAARLDRPGRRLQLILLCGRNQKLAAQLRSRQSCVPLFVEGFTNEVPYYMHLSDFFIGKPGPGSINEALAMKLPVIVERNAWTLPQERYNANWILENQVGLVVPSFRKIDQAVQELLAPHNFAGFRAHVASLHNQALFEIPDILDRIVAADPCYRMIKITARG